MSVNGRYKTNAQRALRDGEFKYLKIRDNIYLFDVVADPRERANLKHRRTDVFDRVVAGWDTWNATMLTEIPDSFGEVSPPRTLPTISVHSDSEPVSLRNENGTYRRLPSRVVSGSSTVRLLRYADLT